MASGAEFINSPSTVRPLGGSGIALQAQQLRDSFQRRLNGASTSNLQHSEDQASQVQSMKDEFKLYLDGELKVALMDIKNNLFEQQFGFERQICNLVNKITA